jgi:hypothetical protein
MKTREKLVYAIVDEYTGRVVCVYRTYKAAVRRVTGVIGEGLIAVAISKKDVDVFVAVLE